MIQVTFNGSPAFLLDDLIDWSSGMEIDADLPVKVSQGLTAREERRPQGDTLRLTVKYSTALSGASIPAFRNALQALNVQPVLCPLWPCWFDAGTAPTVSTAFYILMGDGLAPSIQPAASLPFARPAYPLLVGILTDRPDPVALTDQLEVVSIAFAENDASSISLASFAAPAGLATPNGTRPLFPFRPNWATSPNSGKSDVDIDRRTIGQGRASADAFYPQPSRRTAAQTFSLQATDTWNLLKFFSDMGAVQNSFWLPAGISEALLTSNVSAIATALAVDNPAALAGNANVMLDDGTNRTPLTISGVVGSTWTLPGAVGQAYSATATRIESLWLARFESTTVKIQFTTPAFATCQLSFREIPWDLSGASGETVGTSMGPLPVYAYLYTFTVAYPGVTQVWRYTSFERDLTEGGRTYTAARIEHDTITETATLERQSVNVTGRGIAPLGLFIPMVLEWPMTLDIVECDVTGSTAGNLKAYFSGEVDSVSPEGPFIKASAKSLSHIFDKPILRTLYQTGCNWVVYETGCGLDPATWKFSGTVVSWDPTTLTAVITPTVTHGVTLTDHYFAGGYCVIGTGTATQNRMIADSTMSSGNVSIILAAVLTTAPGVGDTVYFYPGCDGDYATCLNRFNNRAHFRGFPFMPVGNPAAVNVNQSTQGSGKK